MYDVQDYRAFNRLYMRDGILFSCGEHLQDRIISLRGDVWAVELF